MRAVEGSSRCSSTTAGAIEIRRVLESKSLWIVHNTIGAEHAARTVLPGRGAASPKLDDGQTEAIRVVRIAKDSAVKARTTAIITLKAVLVTASNELRATLEPLTDHKRVITCSALNSNGGDITDPNVAMRITLSSSACAGAHPTSRAYNDAPPKVSPRRTSSDA